MRSREAVTDLDRIVRERAYLSWQQEGRADEHRSRAHEQRLRELAYRI